MPKKTSEFPERLLGNAYPKGTKRKLNKIKVRKQIRSSAELLRDMADVYIAVDGEAPVA